MEFLDLSHNHIDETGLKACLGQLPKSLLTLILTGNPCCNSLDVLGELNDLMPNLGIVLGMDEIDPDYNVAGVYEEKGGDKEDGDIEDQGANYKEDKGPSHDKKAPFEAYEDLLLKEGEVLVPEDVLKSIVARKCTQQDLTNSSFNMETTLADLNKECDIAIQQVKSRRQRKEQRKIIEFGDETSTIDKKNGSGSGDMQ